MPRMLTDIRIGLSSIFLSISCLTMTRSQNAEQTMEVSWLTPSKNFKRVHSAGKVGASISWDRQRVIMNDYLEQGRTINGEYYAGELRRLRQ